MIEQPTTRKDIRQVNGYFEMHDDGPYKQQAQEAFTRIVERLRELEEDSEVYEDLIAEVGDYINNPRSPEEKGKVIVQRWVSRITALEAENEKLSTQLSDLFAKHPEEGCYDALPRLRFLIAVYRADHALCADPGCAPCNAMDAYDAETRRLREVEEDK